MSGWRHLHDPHHAATPSMLCHHDQFALWLEAEEPLPSTFGLSAFSGEL